MTDDVWTDPETHAYLGDGTMGCVVCQAPMNAHPEPEELIPCGYEVEINGQYWRCVNWQHPGSSHYLRPRGAS